MPKPQPTKTTTTTTPYLFDDTFTPERVTDAALASQISYNRSDYDALMAQGGFTNVTGTVLDTSDLFYEKGYASGVVLQKEVSDGVHEVYIAFAGTSVEDPFGDVLTYWNLNGQAMIEEYYGDLKALMDAAYAYASQMGYQLVATGHSLGGSAVDGALMDPAYRGQDIIGVTFNSPTAGLVNSDESSNGNEILHIGYENDLLNEIVGDQTGGSVVNNLFYAVRPGEPIGDYSETTDQFALISQALQAYTSPAHDIARFPTALKALAGSDVLDHVQRNDVVVLDGSADPVSLQAMGQLSPSFDKAMQASSRVGLVGQEGAADVLAGSAYGDAIDGGAGADTVNGLGGDDLLWGGEDKDVFVFEGRFGKDVVKDYGLGGVDDAIVVNGQYFDDLTALVAWADKTRQVSASTTDGETTLSFTGGKETLTFQTAPQETELFGIA